MKRKWVIGLAMVAVLLLGFIPDGHAQKKYTLYLGTTDTGVTTPKTVALSGVTEPLLIYDGSTYTRRSQDTTLKSLSILPSGNAILYIDTVTASQAQVGLGGTYTGNTFFVAAKFGHAGSNFNLLEIVPLVTNLAISGSSAYGIPVEIPPGTEHAQFFFGSSGVTNYGNFKASLIVGLQGTDWKPPQAFVIASATLTMTGGQTGVSTIPQMFTGSVLPQGTQYVTVQVQSGGSIYWTADGLTTPVSTGAAPVGTNVALGSSIETTATAARNTWIDVGATTTTLHAQAWSRDPWK